MQIKALIKVLEDLYLTFDDEYKEVMGEPEIAIDLFSRKYPGSANYDRVYGGISNEIIIEEYPRNWPSPVIVSFGECYEEKFAHLYKNSKGQKHSDCLASWPESWEA